MEFEWDLSKAEENASKHGVSFADAAKVFLDPNATEDYDPDHSTADEPRFAKIGLAGTQLLFVIYTIRMQRVRIIHARKATKLMEKRYAEDQNR